MIKRWIRDRCNPPPGSVGFCDPVPDPLVATTANRDTASLAGRSFHLYLGTSGGQTRDYCWTFADDGSIESAQAGRLAWAANGKQGQGFASVGAGSRAVGIGYHGELVDESLLRVTGIEARSGRAVITYGYGQAVDACD